MHTFLIGIGVVLVLMVVVHIIFKVIKFTIAVFLLGVALLVIIYCFQNYLGIDLIGVMMGQPKQAI